MPPKAAVGCLINPLALPPAGLTPCLKMGWCLRWGGGPEQLGEAEAQVQVPPVDGASIQPGGHHGPPAPHPGLCDLGHGQAGQEFTVWKAWVGLNFTWLYIGAQVAVLLVSRDPVCRTAGRCSWSTCTSASMAVSGSATTTAGRSTTISPGEAVGK